MLDMLRLFYPDKPKKDNYTASDPYGSAATIALKERAMLLLQPSEVIPDPDEIWFAHEYPLALKEMVDMGWCRPTFDPYLNADVDTKLLYYTGDDEVLKGFMLFRYAKEEVILEMIYISPKYRGMGHSKRFLNVLKTGFEDSKELTRKSIVCDIYDHNTASIRLFESSDFVPASRNYRWSKPDSSTE